MAALQALAALVIGYLLGSIPFGLIFGSLVGVDVRTMGSGKTGATNVLRSAGPGAGIAVAICDALKGAIPVLLAAHTLATPAQVGATLSPWIVGATGLAAVVGHNYPMYVGFKGGRGVATTGGMALALAWTPTLLVMPFFILPIAITRYVSLGSIIGATVLPFMYLAYSWLTQYGHQLDQGNLAIFLTLLIAAAAIDVSHKDNIARIRAGTERRLGEKATPTVTPA
jgi:glycerol-3-phosphate acyltransferase PlsY